LSYRPFGVTPLFGTPTSMPEDPHFLSVLAARPDADPHRLLNVAGLIAIAVGGELAHYLPLDAPPVPGTLLAEHAAAGRTLPEPEWLELLRQRLRELVDDGVDAVFLVRSLAHYVTDLYEQLANTEAAEEKRAQTRQGMYETAADPERLRSYRRRLAAQDPEYATKSEDETPTTYGSSLTHTSSLSHRRQLPTRGECSTPGNAMLPPSSPPTEAR
jgi:hypothetical protein